ncbi:hypothetical protein N9B20_02750 [Mariniblastus sp.]|nr:hypothetical protein [Mariniblastus sp.]
MKVSLIKPHKFIALTIITCMLLAANTGTAQESAATASPSGNQAKTIDEVPDNFIRFHMWDGSIVAGLVTMDFISINTEFGVLEVPVARIKKLFPGLNSFPELDKKIKMLIAQLSDKDFAMRETAHRELTNMGLQIREQLQDANSDGSAEQKKRLSEIRQAIEEEFEDAEENGESSERALIRGDSIETPEFNIVGKILQKTFTVNSKFGQLTVELSDVKMADRPVQEKKSATKKTVKIASDAFFQRTPANTRIRVTKGDKISIKADGVVQWTNWSTSSTPDGLTNQGQFQGIQSGTLCARIGSSGKIFKVGKEHTGVAKQSGTLYLGIAIQDSYVQQNYRWTGNYDAKVRVTPPDAE